MIEKKDLFFYFIIDSQLKIIRLGSFFERLLKNVWKI